MPVEYVDNPTIGPLNPPEEETTVGQLAGAAFRMENDVAAMYDLLTRPRFTELDQDFDSITAAKQADVSAIFQPRLARAQSQDEFDFILQKIQQEERDREIMARSGWAGIAWGMAAGVISPTVLLPVATAGRGAKAVASAWGLAGIAAGGQEAVLLASQETRTLPEAAVGVATGTVLGGLLGSAAVYLRRGQFDEIASDMDGLPGKTAIHPSAPIGSAGEALPSARVTLNDIKYTEDLGPNAEWLRNKQTEAEARMAEAEPGSPTSKGLTGSVTGTVGQDVDVFVPVALLRTLRGASDEAPGPGAPKFDDLQRKVEAVGWKDDQEGNKILIGVNHKGEAFILEGNNRVAVAHTNGIDTVRVEVQYYNGGNKAGGLFSPENILGEVQHRKTLERAQEIAEGGGAAGAARRGLRAMGHVDEDGNWVPATGIKGAYWLGNQLAKISPIVRAASSKHFPEMTAAIRNLSDAGLQWADNVFGVATSIGGTVENRVKVWNGNLYKALRGLDDIYTKYLEASGPASAKLTSHAMRLGLTARNGKLTRAEFNEQVSWAMWSKDQHEIPEVAQAAQLIRSQVYDPLAKAAARSPEGGGKPLLDPRFIEPDPETGELRKVVGAESYLNRIYDVLRIKEERGSFIQVLTEEGARKMEESFWKKYAKVSRRAARLTQSADDLELDEDVINDIINEVKDDLAKIEGEPRPELTVSDEIDFLRAQARDIKESDPEQAKQLLQDAKDMEAASPEVQELRGKRGDLRARLRNLQSSAGRVSQRRREKLDRAEKIEADQLKSLERIVRAAKKAEKDLAKVSDENLDAEYKKIIDRFHKEARLYDKSEQDIIKLLEDEMGAARRAETQAFPGEVKIKMSPAAVRDIEALFPDEFKGLGLGTGTRAVSAADLRKLASKIENVVTQRTDLGKAKQRNLLKLAGKWQDEIRKTMTADEADLSEAAAIASSLDEVAARQATRGEKMSDILDKADEVTSIDRPFVRDLINAVREDAFRKTSGIVSRRAVRQEKLRAQAKKLDPTFVKERAGKLRGDAQDMLDDFMENARRAGAKVDLENMKADFTAKAEENAIAVTERIISNPPYRVVGLDILTDKRGPELARTLQVDNAKIARWLETDIETNMRAYVRTMAPDVEMYHKFGDANGAKVLSDIRERQRDLVAEVKEKQRAGDLTEDQANAKIKELDEEFANFEHIFSSLVARLKHLRGLPADAEGFGYRAARAALNLNTLRLMGTVMISSIPDIARPVMKYGLLRTFRDGWAPMIQNWQQFKMLAREAHYAGSANDIYMSGRASGIFDIYDDYGRGTAVERGLNYAANRVGNVALFNHWTQWQKQITAGIANGKLWDALEVMQTGKGHMRKAEAVEFLAENGIDESNWRSLWKQLKDGNVRKVNNVWLPNTEDWADIDAQMLYRQFLSRNLDDTIITPGLERPLWMDASPMLKLIAQFRSFAFASNTKMMVAGLQQSDAAVVNGVLLSLTMGAFGYYTYAWAAGGQTLKDMQKAGPDKWADEAIARSGLLGVFGEMQRIAERTPGLKEVATFSGDRTTRRGGEQLIDTLLGPSYGLARTGAAFVTGLDDPTESTLHKMRLMTPYQNVWYLRRALDQIEAATADALDLPRTRR